MFRYLRYFGYLITGKYRRLEKFYRKYVKDNVPSHLININSPGEGKITGVLVGYDRVRVYVRRANFSVASFDKRHVVAVFEHPHYELCGLYAAMSDRVNNYHFEKSGTYTVEPLSEGPFKVDIPAAGSSRFQVTDSLASHAANRLIHFKRAVGEYPELITMFVPISASKQITAWFASELTIVDKELKGNDRW